MHFNNIIVVLQVLHQPAGLLVALQHQLEVHRRIEAATFPPSPILILLNQQQLRRDKNLSYLNILVNTYNNATCNWN